MTYSEDHETCHHCGSQEMVKLLQEKKPKSSQTEVLRLRFGKGYNFIELGFFFILFV